ncbi:hypothetical protein [Methylosinus sporium]|uniref:hypothetical protein n=1 Tax=Methylosinus sporium TaxID=428 RepID=UPI0011B2813F|nr:hypothetical protein [Methylosinus sporium]
MTRAARMVLTDCRIALEMLETEVSEDRWRVLWAGAVALIRAVGHVLDKVDGEQPPIKAAAKAAFARWKADDSSHAIFREFIESERNNILKRYESKVHPLSEVPVAIFLTLSQPETGEIKQIGFDELLGETIFKPIVDGYGEGEDARDIYRDAISWWERELQAIDIAAAG